MTADELHDLAIRTRDAARLAERHGTSVHGYRRAAREACERMGEMAADIELLRENFAALQAKLDEPITAEEQELARAYVAARDARSRAEGRKQAVAALRAYAMRETMDVGPRAACLDAADQIERML